MAMKSQIKKKKNIFHKWATGKVPKARCNHANKSIPFPQIVIMLQHNYLILRMIIMKHLYPFSQHLFLSLSPVLACKFASFNILLTSWFWERGTLLIMVQGSKFKFQHYFLLFLYFFVCFHSLSPQPKGFCAFHISLSCLLTTLYVLFSDFFFLCIFQTYLFMSLLYVQDQNCVEKHPFLFV